MKFRKHIDRQAQKWLRKRGFSVAPPLSTELAPAARRARLFGSYGIEYVYDVGANAGQYARELRASGYRGHIRSFEPLSSAYAQLVATAAGDLRWDAVQVALGATEGQAELHVAGNSYSSSLRDMLPLHREHAPESAYVGTELVPVRRLDALVAQEGWPTARAALKIDVQGYERQVLEGAGRLLDEIATVQLELSLVPLYQDEPLFAEMLAYMTGKGYALVALEPGFSEPRSGRLLQVDAIFHRDPPPASTTAPAAHAAA
jgi:FkbM family methyltransferase